MPILACKKYTSMIRSGKRYIFYSFDGRYKRSHALPMKDCTFIDLYNYDKDYLIGYNRFYDFRKKKRWNTHPYYLIDKQERRDVFHRDCCG